MRNSLQICLAVFMLMAIVASARSEKIVFCYWGTWAHYRNGNGKFQVNNINPNLCTHIGYSFFGIASSGNIVSLDTWLDIDLQNIANTVALKRINPNLKVLAAVGGWNEGSSKYSDMAADATKRTTFIISALSILRQHGLDGLDLDWEYPAQRGGSAADRQNYVNLLKELKAAFDAEKFLLTVAVAAGQESASISYDIPGMSQYVDYINVMAYDFAGAWNSYVGFNSPLTGSGPNTVSAAINYWLQSGAPATKLVLGIPLYGRTFTLSDPTQHIVGSPISGAGTAGPYTREAGYLGYNEICEQIGDWNKAWDATYLVPYAYKNNQWIGYDSAESITLKVNYLKSLNLAGAMVWSIETDDFRGICGAAYPLLSAINVALASTTSSTTSAPTTVTSAPTSTLATTTTTPIVTNVPSTSAPNSCLNAGTFVNREDCSRFYQCSNGYRYDFTCPSGLYFDQLNGICNYPALVNCQP